MKALIELKKECFSRVGDSICFCCENTNPKQLVLHHLSYTKNSIIYSKFENNDDGRLKYYSNLLDEIKQDPNNFLVLCIDCHQVIEKLLKMELYEASNWINGDNYANGMYDKAWQLSFERRDMQFRPKPQIIKDTRSELEDFL